MCKMHYETFDILHLSTYLVSYVSLCIGLPVMIHNNDATELCITKGQEGYIIG